MINTWTANHNTKVVGQNHAICTFQLCRIACDLCHSFPLLCAAPPSIPSHPAVVFAPARALLASCPAPPASSCRAAPPPDPPATAPTWTLTPWSADSSLLDCQVNVKNVIGHCHCDIVTRYWNYWMSSWSWYFDIANHGRRALYMVEGSVYIDGVVGKSIFLPL